MLRSPDVFLTRIRLSSRHALAVASYDRILQRINSDGEEPKGDDVRLVEEAFEDIDQALSAVDRTRARLYRSVPDLSGGGENEDNGDNNGVFILPPMCLRCSEDFIVQFTKDVSIYLVGDRRSQGIFPVVTEGTVRADLVEQCLRTMLIRVYGLASYDFADMVTLKGLLLADCP